MAAHTPGPWVTDAEVEHQSVLGPDGILVADCAIFGGPTVGKARSAHICASNARLIAAAPDYAEAAGLAITALSFALEHAINERDDVAAAQYSAARNALIWADNKRTGRNVPAMKDVTPARTPLTSRAAVTKAEGR